MDFRLRVHRLMVLLLAVLPIDRALAESEGDRVTAPYLQETLRVSANTPRGEGFGFIIGEQAGALYLVTAEHVVSQDSPGAAARVQVFFRGDPDTPVSARVVKLNSSLDLALLRVDRPRNFQWRPQATCTRYERAERVWWVGRDRHWEVPRDNEAGVLKSSEPDAEDRIAFSSYGVKPGVSGAPLIGQRGILGMIVEDAVNQGVAVDIEKIRRFAKDSVSWKRPGCGQESVSPVTAAPVLPAVAPAAVIPAKQSSCWDGWEHRKVCRDRLADGTEGPEMVLLQGGAVTLGSTGGEANSDEKPMSVRVDPYAIGKYEVTRGEYARFVKATGHVTEAEKRGGCYSWDGKQWIQKKEFDWRHPGFEQDDSHPVSCVSWNDAQAYVGWVSKQTGQSYRLPTEAEWEYAARAGTSTERFWGNAADKACEYANVADRTARREFPDWAIIHDCEDGYVYTAPVGHYRPNGFGLYDILGNVWEWTCSLHETSYSNEAIKCTDGAGRRGVRGGAWSTEPAGVRSASRGWSTADDRINGLGFRPARIK